ncbi:unnamed protein product [Pleuronectes platessa]|uniref:Uncharacterized protein n=1 Tax=Pleuronectes platessa TaxID=8262 RepID=A0A9N7VXV1_PLEPL|nr:unnamed protein product [Pleuronectes platessa]
MEPLTFWLLDDPVFASSATSTPTDHQQPWSGMKEPEDFRLLHPQKTPVEKRFRFKTTDLELQSHFKPTRSIRISHVSPTPYCDGATRLLATNPLGGGDNICITTTATSTPSTPPSLPFTIRMLFKSSKHSPVQSVLRHQGLAFNRMSGQPPLIPSELLNVNHIPLRSHLGWLQPGAVLTDNMT